MKKTRNYSYKDVVMLMTSKVIAGNLLTNIAELSTVRSDWTERYATGLVEKIDGAIENQLGIDPKKELRSATSELSAIQTPAKRDLSFFKTQVGEDFKAEPAVRDEILTLLGFTRFIRGVQKGNQQSLVQLLYTFKTNMTETLRAEITSKGISATLIDNIMGYAVTFAGANVNQESLKLSTKEITEEARQIFNSIYDEIIGICKKASAFYQYNPLKKEQFTFSKVAKNLGLAHNGANENTVPDPEV